MDSIEAANELVREFGEFGVTQSPAATAIEREAEAVIDQVKRHKRRLSYSDAVDQAALRIRQWILDSDQEPIALDWRSLAMFTNGRRYSYIWATFVGKAREAQLAETGAVQLVSEAPR